MSAETSIALIRRGGSALVVLAGTTALSCGAGLADALTQTCPPAAVQPMQMCDLGSLRADNRRWSYARAVSADGSVIVGDAETDDGHSRAFRWRYEDGGMLDLGSLRADNQRWSYAYAVSADGSVIVGQAETDDGHGRAFRWMDDGMGMLDLGSLRGDNGQWSHAIAVSADGSVIVGEARTDDNTYRAFRWMDDGQGMLDLGTLRSDNLGWSYARAVSADGSVIIGQADTGEGHSRAFRWMDDGQGMLDLGSLRTDNGQWSYAAAVSADGSVIVGEARTDDNTYRAFRWMDDGQGMLDLGTLRSDNLGWSYARAVSADGSVIVGNADTGGGHSRAFRWRDDGQGMLDLGSLGSDNLTWSYAEAVSADGSVIVGYSATDDHSYRAFRWMDDGLGMLDLGSLRADNLGHSYAYGVSADGMTIVGYADTDDNMNRAFIWRGGTMVDHLNTAQSATDAARTLAAAATGFTHSALGQLDVEIDVLEPATGGGGVTVSSRGQAGVARPRMALRLGGSLLHNSAIASRAGADVALAYDMGQGYTLGGFLDLSRETDSKSAVSLSGTKVSGGAWLRYRANPDHTGLTWRLAASAGSGRFDVTREAILPGTIQGSGSTTVTTSGLSAELGYGTPLANGVAVPFARLSAARTSRAAYSEDVAAAFPLSYDSHRDSAVVATLGVDARFDVAERTTVTAGLGISHDVHRSSNPVTGTSTIPGLTTFSVPGPAVVNRTRGYVSLGVIQGMGNGAAISASATLAQSPWTKSASVSARVGYEMRF